MVYAGRRIVELRIHGDGVGQGRLLLGQPLADFEGKQVIVTLILRSNLVNATMVLPSCFRLILRTCELVAATLSPRLW